MKLLYFIMLSTSLYTFPALSSNSISTSDKIVSQRMLNQTDYLKRILLNELDQKEAIQLHQGLESIANHTDLEFTKSADQFMVLDKSIEFLKSKLPKVFSKEELKSIKKHLYYYQSFDNHTDLE